MCSSDLIFLGFIGAPYFYCYRKKAGFIYCLTNLLLIAGIALLFYFLLEMHIILAILVPFIIDIVFNSMMGVYLFYKPSIKDGRGEFLI